ncbi:glycosyltransferase family 4 protein [Leptolyngbya sp. NIES-2104]|uniref:glycosyltransferase family 4 protein n=1 Tax=Leptolyngbya sp. NIES-2104 TaxID=1552121 RepID=UPI0006EC8B44|nr:glycosyltransferase family 4 protein [Leptolyngbya sp. NIES-2104]GAP95144.1 glycosyltransferase [Leptolyngbya sp. NIES-2104]
MRLLFVNAVGAIGGAERVLLTMIDSLRKLDRRLEIFLIVGTHGALIEAAEALGVTVVCLPLPQPINRFGDSGARSRFLKFKLLLKVGFALPEFLDYRKRFHRLIQKIQPDLIHSNSIKTHLLLAALPRIQAPIVWHIHDFYQSRPVVARILQWAQSSAVYAIAVSNAVAKDAKSLLPRVPIGVVYNAVPPCLIRSVVPNPSVNATNPRPLNPPFWETLKPVTVLTSKEILHSKSPTRGEFRGLPRSVALKDQSGITHSTVQIGLVATFARWKGHDVFLRAAAQVVRELPGVPMQFLIVGAPIYQTQGSQYSIAELQAGVARLGLDRFVQFIGFQSDPAAIYEALDIVVHASTQPEPFGLVIAEAMSFGKAVIVSYAGGAAELITPEYDAIAVLPKDVDAIAQAMIRLIQKPEERERLGQNAKRTALERFNSDRLGSELLEVYRRCGLEECSIRFVADPPRNGIRG